MPAPRLIPIATLALLGAAAAARADAPWSFVLTASSEETGRTNLAVHAMDNDPSTRWCANGGGANQWLQIDLGGTRRISGLDIRWESDGKSYGVAVEGGDDGRQWTRLAADASRSGQRIAFVAKVRFVRIRVTALPDSRTWASIRELTLLDFGGAPIPNARK